MIAPISYPADEQFEEIKIAKAERCGEGWSIEREDGWSFHVPASSPIEPAPGMKARFYGKGVGYTVRGLFIDGLKVFYRTEAEEKIHHNEETYGATAEEWLHRWDSGRPVWSVEMGGLGPGYEQAIQITVAEVLRIMLAGKFDGARWKDTDAWKADRENIEQAGFKNATIDRLGLSGSQWGAALNVAARLYMAGPIETLTDPRIKDRLIQVAKTFPQG